MECAVRQRTGDLDAEIALPQRGGQLLHDVVRQLHIRAFDRALDAPLQTLGIRHGVVERRLVELDAELREVVFKVDPGGLDIGLQLLKNGDLRAGGEIGRFHAALVGGRDIRHQYGHIAGDLACAAQPPSGCVVLLGNVARGIAVHLALDQLHAALAARAVAAARRVDGDVGAACGLQQGGTRRDGDHDRLRVIFKLENDLRHVSFLLCIGSDGGGRPFCGQ